MLASAVAIALLLLPVGTTQSSCGAGMALVETLLEGYSDSINAVTFSPNGELLASAGWDRTVKLWSHEGNCSKPSMGHTGSSISVSLATRSYASIR
jgi:WD40 repeat protein